MIVPSRETAQRLLSPGRYRRYVNEANADNGSAIRLYEWNVELSSAMFEIVRYVEIALRNAH
jgi:hypothetical protein